MKEGVDSLTTDEATTRRPEYARDLLDDFLTWAEKGGIALCSPMPGGGGRYYPMMTKREYLIAKYLQEKKDGSS